MTRTKKVIVLKEETCSQLEKIEYHIRWNIPNFAWHNKMLSSSVFTDQDKTLQWKILLDPCRRIDRDMCVCVFVRRVGSEGGVCHSLDVSILNSDGSTPLTEGYFWKDDWWTYGDFVGRGFVLVKRATLLEEANHFLCDGALSLFWKFSVTTFTEKGIKGMKSRVCNTLESHLTRDLENLFETRSGCDVTLRTNDAELSAHKAILMARSSVFAAMFEDRMTDHRVQIPDLSSEVLREMLRFMYTGKNPEEGKVTTELLMGAEKYDLALLKAICEDTLSSNISIRTAAKMLRDADKYNAQQLKTAAILFIEKHGPDVITTEGWKNLVQHQPHLVAEVVKAMSVQIGFSVAS